MDAFTWSDASNSSVNTSELENGISISSVDRWEKADVVYLGETGSDDTNRRMIQNNGARNAKRRAKVGRRGFCSLRAKRDVPRRLEDDQPVQPVESRARIAIDRFHRKRLIIRSAKDREFFPKRFVRVRALAR